MKKLFLLLAMSSICICSSAQNAFGIKAGVNLASMSFDVDDEFGSDWNKDIHPLLTASILGKIELSYTANLTLELGLAQRGFKVSYDEDGQEADASVTINQIQFSPGIAFNASDEFSIGFAPYIGYATQQQSKVSFDPDPFDESDTDTSDLDDESKLDYGLNVNLNYLIDDSFLISAGYSLGLKDYNAHNNEEYDLDLDPLTNSGIMISIGYLFGN
tara:strand:+ start:245 stop:892 length:648 start_codon:yes stop_codon:yes gene_type:complete